MNAIKMGDTVIANSELTNLLGIMRDMHNAALDEQWNTVEALDQQRNTVLDRISNFTDGINQNDTDMIVEILQLDQGVLSLTQKHLDFAATQVSSTVVENKVRKAYHDHI
ncbi:MAG: flagellar protein FliT [Granulosicoccus sp.]|nr:flagellar protein FliT [Granulosicoccus sp.]